MEHTLTGCEETKDSGGEGGGDGRAGVSEGVNGRGDQNAKAR